MDYAVDVYRFTANLPAGEKYNLVSQLRRAVTSIPLNIAEGCDTATNTDFSRFLTYAYRSSKEVVTAVELCHRLYPKLPKGRLESVIHEGNQLSRMIYRLIPTLDLSDSKL